MRRGKTGRQACVTGVGQHICTNLFTYTMRLGPASVCLLRATLIGSARRTLPAAQSIMSSRGRLARGMVVVFHHIGRPRHRTTNQNDIMTSERLRESEGLSGGGSFRRELVSAAMAAGGVFGVLAVAGWARAAMSMS
jgi:hypothetical protein